MKESRRKQGNCERRKGLREEARRKERWGNERRKEEGKRTKKAKKG